MLQEAANYYDEGNLKNAVEKLKIYYSPTLDKKKSIGRIIDDMSGQKNIIKNSLKRNFLNLRKLGIALEFDTMKQQK
uniref:hypothetical protein n=1 Tax=Paenibacillus sp. IHBB 10380 TaxID=1566358 RepID=UPI000695C80D|nr:hypothetical protein [Paenibacillus sp. IHBB 10380]